LHFAVPNWHENELNTNLVLLDHEDDLTYNEFPVFVPNVACKNVIIESGWTALRGDDIKTKTTFVSDSLLSWNGNLYKGN